MFEDEIITQHEHNCDRCVFLGTHLNFDLYYCPSPKSDKIASTVIARYGKNGDYTSGNVFSHPPFTQNEKNPLYVARKRAEKLGIKVPKEIV